MRIDLKTSTIPWLLLCALGACDPSGDERGAGGNRGAVFDDGGKGETGADETGGGETGGGETGASSGETGGSESGASDEGANGGPGCTRTRGFWQTHNVEGVAKQDPWPIDESTPLCDATWLDRLHTPPRGDAFVILAAQWIAARLNVASDADASAEVLAAIDEATEMLESCAITSPESSTFRAPNPAAHVCRSPPRPSRCVGFRDGGS